MTAERAPWAARRGKTASVLAILAGAAVCLVSSTQPWVVAVVADAEVAATGAQAVPLLQPLSLAALAGALSLTLTGRVMRFVLAAIALLIAGGLVVTTAPVAFDTPLSTVQVVVTEHTGLTGDPAVRDLVDSLVPTAWPAIGLAAAAIAAAGAVLALVTGARWRQGGRRFSQASAAAASDESRTLDAVDSWDDLSRGDDPTRPGD